MLYKNFKKLVSGFIKFQTVPWMVVVFSVLAVITQIADRFPANYFKTVGVNLSENITFLKILEEGGESLLSLLLAIGILQCLIYKKENKYLVFYKKFYFIFF